jgi:hypothetical protein
MLEQQVISNNRRCPEIPIENQELKDYLGQKIMLD